MKKIILTGAFALFIFTYVLSQDAGPSVAFTKTATSTKNPEIAPANPGALLPNEINEKALKHFSRNCKEATNVRWYEVAKEATTCYYDLPDKKGRSVYDKKGRLVYNILSYSEEVLSAEVRNLVKYDYPGYSIDFVQEVFNQGTTIFIVHVSDKKTIKQLIVYNGEITVYKDMNKSN